MNFLGTNSVVNESLPSSQLENYKIIFIGDIFVGKTSIISRYKYEVIESVYSATVGIDFITKDVFLEDKIIRLILWDTAGQERFRSLIPSYLRNAKCIILVYDISNKSTFVSLNKWYLDSKKHVSENTLFAICGNKSDLKRAVTKEEIENFSNKNNIPIFMEVSALTGEGINDLFNAIIKKFCDTVYSTDDENQMNDINENERNNEDMKSQSKTLKNLNKNEETIKNNKKRKKCC